MFDLWTTWPAPAKLNLLLHIVGRRADGYHLLQTVFQLLDWGDEVRLRVRGDAAMTRVAGLESVLPEGDIAVRAAQALRAYTGTRYGADIEIIKRIPVGAGLGGGSSDAATVLVAMNELWGTGLSVDALAEIGLGLGADVPVFVRGRSAWAEGVGERLTPVDLPKHRYVIIDPRVPVSTAALFQAPELTRNSPPTTIPDFLAGLDTVNAFAPVVCARYPVVAQALGWLGHFGDARLSGSGGCIFATMESEAQADAIIRACPPEFAVYRAMGVNRSPLYDALDGFRAEAGKQKTGFQPSLE